MVISNETQLDHQHFSYIKQHACDGYINVINLDFRLASIMQSARRVRLDRSWQIYKIIKPVRQGLIKNSQSSYLL
jgi:hypothetical protein